MGVMNGRGDDFLCVSVKGTKWGAGEGGNREADCGGGDRGGESGIEGGGGGGKGEEKTKTEKELVDVDSRVGWRRWMQELRPRCMNEAVESEATAESDVGGDRGHE